jgi:MFS family permease
MSAFRLCSKNFVLACTATFLYFGSFYLTLPVLPRFVAGLDNGGAPVGSFHIGLVSGFMTMMSVLVRPYFGRLSDARGRRIIMVLASLCFALLFLAYMFVDAVRPLYVIRMAHGAAHGAMLAALFAFVADLAPRERRGEVMGVHGVANVLAMALFPAAGSLFMDFVGSYTGLFMLSLAMGALACCCVLPLDDLRPAPPAPGTADGGRERLLAVFGKSPVITAACTFMSASILYGAIITFLPIYGPERNVPNVGLFFTVYALFTFVSRLLAGKLSDRYGRSVVIIPSLCLVAAGGFILAMLDGSLLLALAGVCMGLGFGGFMPALNAFVVDNTSGPERSTALAFYTSFMDVGMTVGAMGFGLLGGAAGYSGMYLAAACVTCCGVALFTAYSMRRGRPGRQAGRPEDSGKAKSPADGR